MSAQVQKESETAAEKPRKKKINMKDLGRQVRHILVYNILLQVATPTPTPWFTI